MYACLLILSLIICFCQKWIRWNFNSSSNCICCCHCSHILATQFPLWICKKHPNKNQQTQFVERKKDSSANIARLFLVQISIFGLWCIKFGELCVFPFNILLAVVYHMCIGHVCAFANARGNSHKTLQIKWTKYDCQHKNTHSALRKIVFMRTKKSM